MRGKVAKALRKEVGFTPKAKREYQTFIIPTVKKILQYDSENGKVNIVDREVESRIVECVTGSRKLYKYLKRKYMNFEHEEVLNELPSAKELRDLQQEIATDFKNTQKEETNE